MWEATTINPGATRHWQVGPCKLWVRRLPDEWQTYVERDPDSPHVEVWAVDDPGPGEATWTRFAAVRDDHQVEVRPQLPERPVIVRPETSFLFPGGSDLTFYVSIPLHLGIFTGPGGERSLGEVPTVILSNSFFGEPTTGQLGFALKTTARRDPADLRQQPHLAACPVHVRNPTGVTMAFERLCLYTRHLAIYKGSNRLWTSLAEVTYRGPTEPQQLKYPDRTGPEAGEVEPWIPPREPAPQGRLQRQLSAFKSFIT